MPRLPQRPPINPVLLLRRRPVEEGVPGGGKERKDIRVGRLTENRPRLAEAFRRLAKRDDYPVNFAGHTVLHVVMSEDSQAVSWTPKDFFRSVSGPKFLAPYKQGFIIDLPVSCFKALSRTAQTANTVGEMVDLSRIDDVRLFGEADVYDGQSAQSLWESAPIRDGQRLLTARLLPLRDDRASEALIKSVKDLNRSTFSSPGNLLAGMTDLRLFPATEARFFQREIAKGDRVARMIRYYNQTRRGTSTILVRSPQDIERIVASGAFFKLEASSSIVAAKAMRSVEPNRPHLPELSNAPIVGVVDGGLDAASYYDAEAWAATPLVADRDADRPHGNRVTSLVVQGAAWNPELNLPPLVCRVGTAQAVPKKGALSFPTPEELAAYLSALMGAHPEVKVWNLSFNTPHECDPEQMSFLGHLIAQVCRLRNTLPVISVGNGTQGSLRPPADCEAALTVGGHLEDGSDCPVSLPGPGPVGTLMPIASHVSRVRVLGGAFALGSSFATALTSPLAAHTEARLVKSSPDMIRALIANKADGQAFDPRRGFGSLATGGVPWNCSQDAITLMWEAELKPNIAYYWELPIPRALLPKGKLSGSGALTAVLNPHPLVDDLAGENYFGIRANVALQYPAKKSYKNLLGKMDTDTVAEAVARRDWHKWCSIRHHAEFFGARGLSVHGDKLRVHARLFTRDLYAFGYEGRRDELPPFNIAFVLTLRSVGSSDLYDDYRVQLGSDIEVGVIDTTIDVENE